ncbi:antitoxin [soil metagenome]
MCHTSVTVYHMSKMIQIRNVPDVVHREVKVRAARAGMSLSDFLLREVVRLVETPPVEDVLARLAGRARPRLTETPAEAVRAEREAG